MRELRVSIAAMACAVTLLVGACSRLDRPVQEELVSESLSVDQEPSPTIQSDLTTETASQETDELVAIQENAAGPDDPDPEAEADRGLGDAEAEQAATPDPNIVERKSSDASRAKGEINFDDLKFEIEKDAPFEDKMLTKELRELDGKNVKLRGYILPATLFSETNISQFVLVRDNQECCFGPGAALFDCVMIEMVDGATTDFVTRPVTVEGTFVVDTDKYRWPPGYSPTNATHMAVFRIDGKTVK